MSEKGRKPRTLLKLAATEQYRGPSKGPLRQEKPLLGLEARANRAQLHHGMLPSIEIDIVIGGNERSSIVRLVIPKDDYPAILELMAASFG